MVRDGRPYPPAQHSEVEILPGVAEALTDLRDAGFKLLVVTNQPDVARGTTPRAFVEDVNQLLSDRLPLDGFYVCYHDDDDRCACRKPRPGLLLQAAAEWGIDLPSSYMVGDRWRDIEAGAAAGCTTVLVVSEGAYLERVPAVPDMAVTSLHEAATIITRGSGNDRA
jgi:D-glycero-D-manno-heptose 1,7-bisphosphate phosphatase